MIKGRGILVNSQIFFFAQLNYTTDSESYKMVLENDLAKIRKYLASSVRFIY